jgi:crotonobetainyl-CoA:carnitine CoA-transferase CaiB-like acyl-CoA transferase
MQQSRRQAPNPLWNRYPTKDKWVFLCLANTDENWSALCESLERPELAGDPRFGRAVDREEHNGELIALLDEVLEERSAQEWIDRWRSRGIAAGPIQNLKDVAEDPQAWENDYFVKAHCGEIDREVDVRGLPIKLSKTPGRVESLGPELGQDTELILADVLGIDWDRIGELKERGVIP